LVHLLIFVNKSKHNKWQGNGTKNSYLRWLKEHAKDFMRVGIGIADVLALLFHMTVFSTYPMDQDASHMHWGCNSQEEYYAKPNTSIELVEKLTTSRPTNVSN